MEIEEENKGLLELLKNIPIPDIIKSNAITALAKGIGKIITSASNIPISYFDSISSEITAKSNAKIKLIESSSSEASNLFKTDSELANRALSYFGSRIIQEQVNREEIAKKTIHNLSSVSAKDCKEGNIDEDWVTQFWRLAETKTKNEVKEILARILTKEIIAPKSVSPNTLQLLSVLTSVLGNSFQRLSNLSIDDGESCFVIHPNVFAFQNIGPLDDFDVRYNDLFELDGANLIRSAETLMVNYEESEKPTYEKVNYAGLTSELDVSGQQLHLIQFTKAGRELRNLIELVPNQKYTEKLKEKLGESLIIK